MDVLAGAFEVPDPSFEANLEDKQYSFKENSPLFEYLSRKEPGAIRTFGFYRLNFILTVLFRIIRREKLFDRTRKHFIVCDSALQKALNRSWFSVTSIVRIIMPQLDVHTKPYTGEKKGYHTSYNVEINAITELLNW